MEGIEPIEEAPQQIFQSQDPIIGSTGLVDNAMEGDICAKCTCTRPPSEPDLIGDELLWLCCDTCGKWVHAVCV